MTFLDCFFFFFFFGGGGLLDYCLVTKAQYLLLFYRSLECYQFRFCQVTHTMLRSGSLTPAHIPGG